MRTAVLVALACAIATGARAAPTITVKARTMVHLDPIKRIPGGIEVSGVLADRALREPVPWATLSVWLDDAHRLAQTDDVGQFSLEFPVTEGVHSLRIEYVGDRHYAGSSVELPRFDVTKEPIALTVRASRKVGIGTGTLKVAVAARSEHGPIAVPVSLSLVDADGGTPASLGDVTTGDDGRGVLEVPTDRLGEPGRKRVFARFAGSDAYDVAAAETDILVVTGTALTLELDNTEIAYEDDLRASGRLTDGRGGGIPDATVAMMAGSQRVGSAVTGADGGFAITLAADEIGAGKTAIQARFEPADPWLEDSRSTPIPVTVLEPQPVPIGYTLGAFAATSFAVLAFVLLRTRPWAGLLARLRPLPESPGARRDGGSGDTVAVDDVHTGLAPARPGLVSTLRRAHEAGFSGTVCDAVSGRPLPGATLELQLGERALALTADAAGRFEIGELPAGTWRCEASLATYCTEAFSISIPHRGELRGARIDLLQVRERIFHMYREVAVPLLPDPSHWGIWTPRQIFDFVRGRHPAPALATLTDYVERAYFSHTVPDEDALAQARARIDAAIAESRQAGLWSGPPSDV